jgi:hypothetical protein
MHGVIAQVMATAQDPVGHLRVLHEPGPDGKHSDRRSRSLCFA